MQNVKTFQYPLLNGGTGARLFFIVDREVWLKDDRMGLQTELVAAGVVLPHDVTAFLTVEPL